MSRDREASKPLTNRAITIGAITVVLIGGVILTTLLVLYGTSTPQDLARLEAVRTVGAVVVGTGGAIALLQANCLHRLHLRGGHLGRRRGAEPSKEDDRDDRTTMAVVLTVSPEPISAAERRSWPPRR